MSSTFPIVHFRGLNLAEEPAELGSENAIDLLNVDLDQHGRVRTRDGYAKFTSVAGAASYSSLHSYPSTGSSNYLLASIQDSRLQAIDNNGAVLSSETTGDIATPNFTTCALVGKPGTAATAEQVLAYVGDGNVAPKRFDGSVWTIPTATVDGVAGKVMPKGAPYYYPHSSRLVSTCFEASAHTAGPNGLPSSQSHVWFSDAGDPESWTGNPGAVTPPDGNYVILTPGDGQRIHGAAAFGNDFYVFKASRFFVFYGESEDPTGGVEFQYRTVEGVGLSGYSAGMEATNAICSGTDGIYFLNADGVWRTTGYEPVRVSRPLDPFFNGTADITLNPQQLHKAAMCWHDERLWLTVATGVSTTNNRVLVYDPLLDEWMMHDFAAAGLVSHRATSISSPDLFFSYATGTSDIGRHGPSSTDDAGVAVAWRYQSGWYDLGVPGREKNIVDSSVDGIGTVTLSRFADYSSTDTNAAAVVLGTSPAAAVTRHRKSWRGTLMSHKLSGSGVAVVNSLAHEIRSVRPAGVRSS